MTRTTRAVLQLLVAGCVGGVAVAQSGLVHLGDAPEAPRPRAEAAAPPEAGAAAAPGARAPIAATEGPGVAVDGAADVTVTHAGAPVAGADVRAYLRVRTDPRALGWRLAGSAQTGADGRASIPTAPGEYLVAARAPGLAHALVVLVRPAGEAATRAAVAMAPLADVRGRVLVRGTREPVPLASVELVPRDLAARGMSPLPDEERLAGAADAWGRFRLAVAPGAHAVEASATGHARGRAEVEAPGSADVQLAAGAVVEGFVRGPDGAPAPGAEVILAGAAELARGTAGASGGFAVEVTPGTYAVSARTDRAAGGWPEPVVVAAGGRVRGIVVVLGAPAAISGTVRGAEGRAVPGASVAVFPHGGAGELARALTDADGRFSVDALTGGAYDVAVAAEGCTRALRTGIVLMPGERLEIAVALERSGGVAGTVSDPAGRPLAGVRVRARSRGSAAEPGLAAEARTDVAGRFAFAALPVGPHELTAMREDASGGVSAFAAVAAGAVARADLTLPETGRLAGTVARRDRGPLSQARVFVYPRGSPIPAARAEVDAAGRWDLQLPAGEYVAVARARDDDDALGGNPRARTAVRVEPGRSAQLELALADDGEERLASVQVLEPGGAAAAGALVLVTTADDLRRAGSGTTDEEGLARVELGLRGRLHARAYAGGRVGGPVPLDASGTTVVPLRAGARLQGQVLAVDGSPVSGFTLHLVALGDDADVANNVGGAAGRKAATASEAPRRLEFGGSRFDVPDAPAGPVRVVVHTPSGRVGRAELQLAPGERRELQVVIDPGAGVAGQAIDARTRRPLPGAQVMVVAGDRAPGQPEATADPDGRFRLTGLPAGPTHLRVVARGHAPAERALDLVQDAESQIGEVALVEEAPLTAAR